MSEAAGAGATTGALGLLVAETLAAAAARIVRLFVGTTVMPVGTPAPGVAVARC